MPNTHISKAPDFKLKVPNGFFTLMELFLKALLKSKPRDVFDFGARFFEFLLQTRTESGHDPCAHGEKPETSESRISTKLKTLAPITLPELASGLAPEHEHESEREQEPEDEPEREREPEPEAEQKLGRMQFIRSRAHSIMVDRSLEHRF